MRRLTKSRFISSLRGSREIKTPPTAATSCVRETSCGGSGRASTACIAPAFTTATAAAVGMMDDLVDNEEKNHQAPRLALESTV